MYFYKKYRINIGEVAVEHCPTDDMLAEYFTMPVQGAKFRALQARIMGIPEKYSIPRASTHASTK